MVTFIFFRYSTSACLHGLPGPLVYMSVAGQNMVVMNTHKVAADLLDRRAAVYSDRPRLVGKLT